MSENNKTHFRKLNFVLLVPILALICTPLIPFVNNGGYHIGIPNVCLWVMAWSVITTILLAILYQKEPELDEEITEILGERADAVPPTEEVK